MKLPHVVPNTLYFSGLYHHYHSRSTEGIAMVSSEESPFIDVKGHFFTMVELKSYRHALLRENRACSCFESVVDPLQNDSQICLLCILCTMFALRQPSFFIPFGLLVSGVLLSFLSTLFKRDIGFIIVRKKNPIQL